jgi:hypothetical protein
MLYGVFVHTVHWLALTCVMFAGKLCWKPLLISVCGLLSDICEVKCG